jgi:metal-dependent amidase/aminoacylase/carboxypeptidase family protein
MLEYDALPNGHSCGHNLTRPRFGGGRSGQGHEGHPGRVIVIGTPDEERDRWAGQGGPSKAGT